MHAPPDDRLSRKHHDQRHRRRRRQPSGSPNATRPKEPREDWPEPQHGNAGWSHHDRQPTKHRSRGGPQRGRAPHQLRHDPGQGADQRNEQPFRQEVGVKPDHRAQAENTRRQRQGQPRRPKGPQDREA